MTSENPDTSKPPVPPKDTKPSKSAKDIKAEKVAKHNAAVEAEKAARKAAEPKPLVETREARKARAAELEGKLPDPHSRKSRLARREKLLARKKK